VLRIADYVQRALPGPRRRFPRERRQGQLALWEISEVDRDLGLVVRGARAASYATAARWRAGGRWSGRSCSGRNGADLRGPHAATDGAHPACAAARQARRLAVLRLPPLRRDRLSPARVGSRRRALPPLVLPRPGPRTTAQAPPCDRAPRARWHTWKLRQLHVLEDAGPRARCA